MTKDLLLSSLKGGLIVSCQALEGEPLYRKEGGIMPLMAVAAQYAGVAAIRANSVLDISQIKEKVNLPVIGIIKKSYSPFEQFITATMEEVDQLTDVGADIVALDCTNRPRFDGKTIIEHITHIKSKYPYSIIMADISNYDEGITAASAGADIIGTTLCGYTPYTYNESLKGPSFELVRRLSESINTPVIAEGKIHYPWEARRMLEMGAWSVVVGGAITRPMEIAKRFVDALKKQECSG